MSENPETTVSPVIDEQPTVTTTAATDALAAAMAAMPVNATTTHGLKKFAGPNGEDANKFGITNDRGQVVTTQYLARYIQCWCRIGDGYLENRKQNFAYFMSDEFLSAHRDLHASEVGHAAANDPRWHRVIPAGEKHFLETGELIPASELAKLAPADPIAEMTATEPIPEAKSEFEAAIETPVAAPASEPAPVKSTKKSRREAIEAARMSAAASAAEAAGGAPTMISADNTKSLA